LGWEAEPAAETNAGLKKLGVESVVFEPCGNLPASGVFLAAMLKNLADYQIVYGDQRLWVMCLEYGIRPTIAIAPWRLVEFIL
jgi:hypothetical protein